MKLAAMRKVFTLLSRHLQWNSAKTALSKLTFLSKNKLSSIYDERSRFQAIYLQIFIKLEDLQRICRENASVNYECDHFSLDNSP